VPNIDYEQGRPGRPEGPLERQGGHGLEGNASRGTTDTFKWCVWESCCSLGCLWSGFAAAVMVGEGFGLILDPGEWSA
jgi:hypothetical protein